MSHAFHSKLIFVPLVAACLAGSSRALAQCPFDWRPGEGIRGVGGTVYATTTWDPDGAGPQPELLIVGGPFTVAGDVLANNIAAWDGAAWQPLGTGMNSYVDALTVYNGELIAGGLVHHRRRREREPHRPLGRRGLAAAGDGDERVRARPNGL